MSELKNKDIELWKKWKASNSNADLEILMKQMAGAMQSQIGRWVAIVPKTLLENEAKKLALQAFNSYNPTLGVALNTHLTNWLLKLSRIAYERQSSVSVPEHKRISYNQLKQLKTTLEEQLGFPPTTGHLADHLGISEKKILTLLSEVEKKELLESEEHPETSTSTEEEKLIDFAFHDMTPTQQNIFKLKTGYSNTIRKNNNEIIKQLGISQGQLSYELTKIQDIILKSQNRKRK